MNTCLENAAVPSLNLLDTVVQGDCVEVMRQLPTHSVDLIVTDPPYLARYRSRDGRTLQNDSDSSWLVPAFRETFRVLRKDRFILCFYGWPKIDEFFAAWRGAGFQPVGHLVFRKSYTSSTRFLRYQHESAYLLAKGNPPRPANPISDVLELRYTGNFHHPTEKDPMALVPVIKSFSQSGEIVLDPFCGSGSTLIAAHSLERHFIGIELDKNYHAITSSRMAHVMGRLGSSN